VCSHINTILDGYKVFLYILKLTASTWFFCCWFIAALQLYFISFENIPEKLEPEVEISFQVLLKTMSLYFEALLKSAAKN